MPGAKHSGPEIKPVNQAEVPSDPSAAQQSDLWPGAGVSVRVGSTNFAATGLPLAEQAYRVLLASITDGTLGPGTRLREVDIASRLGISRTPVREALRRLQAEGLVTHSAGAGLTVKRLDQAATAELYTMRELLEGTAAGLAARHATATEILALRECADRDAALLDSPERLADNNRAFHQTLYRAAHNRYLLTSLHALQTSLILLGRTTLSDRSRAITAAHEHQVIVAAIENRDAPRAEAITRAHIRAAFEARVSQRG